MKKLEDGIIGLAIGDALGVPVQFASRTELEENPVTTMREYGEYNQPKGTWSDDTSLTLCLVEALNHGFSLKHIANNFIKWRVDRLFTPFGEVFDIGVTTRHSIKKLQKIIASKRYEDLESLKYETNEKRNGNGSLMRILPLYKEVKKNGIEEEFAKIRNVSALTHGHIRSAISCLLYLIMVNEIDNNQEKNKAYENTQIRMRNFFKKQEISKREQQYFKRLVIHDIRDLKKSEINSSGYVIDSLEASIWCFLKTKTYSQAVLKAVNLGEDTDTTGAITGGLAGFYYGDEKIPLEWKNDLVAYDFIKSLCQGEKITNDDSISLEFPEEIAEIQIKKQSFFRKLRNYFRKK